MLVRVVHRACEPVWLPPDTQKYSQCALPAISPPASRMRVTIGRVDVGNVAFEGRRAVHHRHAGEADVVLQRHANGVWLWVAFDNLRVAALTAVECAETMTASRPRGQIQ